MPVEVDVRGRDPGDHAAAVPARGRRRLSRDRTAPARPRRDRRRGRDRRARQAAAQVGVHAARRGGAQRARRRRARRSRDVDAVFSAGALDGARRPPSTSASARATSTARRSAAARSSSTSQHAAAAIDAGLCDVALITHGESGALARRHAGRRASAPTRSGAQFEEPFGARRSADRLRAGRRAPHARVRHHAASSSPRSPSRRASGRSSTRAP